ncbi:MAG: AAA family ATPase [bacterium]|nr:AAA family ATPase [bacterium]
MADSTGVLEFEGWELDLDREELRRDGVSYDIQAKLLELLLHLARNRDRTVSRTELFSTVWADVVVCDDAVSSALKDLRKLLGDDGSRQRIIQTRRRIGYRFVADAVRIGEDRGTVRRLPLQIPPMRPKTDASRKTPLLGRRTELAALERYLDDVSEGHPRIVLISGDEGIGKSRLVEEFTGVAQKRIRLIGTGHAVPDSGFPYRPVISALGTLVVESDEFEEESYGEDLAPIRELLHPDPNRAIDWEQNLSLDAKRERGELFSSLTGALIRLANDQPIVLVIEDAHWADSATLELITHLSLVLDSQAHPVHCLLIVTTRGGTPEDTLVDAAMERIERSDIARRIRLEGLDELSTSRLLDDCKLRHVDRELGRGVFQASGGNPFFVRELATHLLRTRPTPGDSSLSVPSSIVSLLGERLGQLSDECIDALSVASYFGDRFSRLALSAATTLHDIELEDLLAEALDAGVLQRDGQTFCFEHAMIKLVLRSRVPEEQRGQIHALIAEVLEALYATSADDHGHARHHALEISNHLIRAGGEVETTRVIAYAREAGEQAFAICAWAEAARHFAAAADAALQQGDDERARLHFRAAVAFNHDLRAEEAVSHYRNAIALFIDIGDRKGLVWARMFLLRARITIAVDSYGAEVEIGPLQDAIDSLGREEAVLRGLALETIAEAYWMAGKKQKATEAAASALVIGHNQDNDVLCHYACLGLALSAYHELNIVEALDHWKQAFAHAERSRDPWLQTVPPARIAMSQVVLGQHEAARTTTHSGLDLARRAQNWSEISMVLAQQAVLAFAGGEFSRAADLASEVLVLIERTGYPWAGPVAVPLLAASEAFRGEFGAAEAALDLLTEPGRIFAKPSRGMSLIRDAYQAWVGERPGGTPRLSTPKIRRLADVLARHGSDPFSVGAACALAEVGVRRNEPKLIDALLPLLSHALERGVVFGPACPILVPRVIGQMEAVRKNFDRARFLLEQAVDIARQSEATLELGLSQRDLSQVLKVSDHDGATAATEAAEILCSLGQKALSEMSVFGEQPWATDL